MSLLAHYDEEKAQRVLDLEDKVDKYEDELGSYLVKLSSKNLTEKDSHSLSILLHSIGDFERISDHAINIKEAAEEMTKKDQHFSNKALVELEIFSNALKEVVDLTFDVFKTEDLTRAAQVEPLEEEIDYLQAELKRRHIKRLRKGKCTIEMGFILSDVLTSYERVADHCSNIAACLMEVNDDAFDIHEYKLDIENKKEFEMSFKKLKEKSYDGISNIMNLSLLLVAVLNLMLIILAPEAVSILAPKSYQEAIWIIPPLAASVVVMFFYQHFVNVEFFFEESRITSAASIGAALLNVGLNYWLIPKFGYLAAGYTTLASYSVFGVVHYIFMCLVCKKNNCPKTIFDIKIMLLIMAMFAGVTVAVAIGYTHLWLRLAVLAIILILLIVKRKVVVGALKQIMKGKRSKSSRL
mgnify:CR=1 FL=1